MYAIVRRYKTESIDKMASQVDGEFADQIPQQVGSLLYTAVDTGDGTAMTFVLFADERSARRSETLVGKVEETLASELTLEIGEVSRGPVMVSRAADGVLEPVNFRAGK
jgi:hypothetical protein